MSPRDFALAYILRWEDGGSTEPNKTHSLDPADSGNWSGGKIGFGQIIGSNHGVTAIALAKHRHLPVAAITRDVMHALTIGEAADVALDGFYLEPGLARLPWNPLTASAMDMGWGAGPFHGNQLLQRTCGAGDDGVIGRGTVGAFTAYIARVGIEAAARAYAAQRYAYYEATIRAHPEKAKYRNGWRARTDSFLPGTPWWKSWGELSAPTAANDVAAPAPPAAPSMAARLIAGVKRVMA